MTAVVYSAAPLNDLRAATVRTRVSVPLRFADGYAASAEVMTFHGLTDGREHLLLGLGDWEQVLLDGARPPLVRLHSECMTGDVFGSERCDCGPQLREAVEAIASTGGFLLYLRQEGRGIGLYSKLDAYALQDQGLDTYDANLALGHGEDERDYAAAAQMLCALGATTVRLLTNNPDKAAQLAALGIVIEEQVPTGVHLSEANSRYLEACRRPTPGTSRPSETGPAIRWNSTGPPSCVQQRPLPEERQAMQRCSPASTPWFPGCGPGPKKPNSCAACPRRPCRSCMRPASTASSRPCPSVAMDWAPPPTAKP
jgi:GTP cyclohydrolase II